MNELSNFKNKADLWWQERRGLLTGLFRNPLFFALGVRISQPDPHSVVLRLPWNRKQRLFASEIPMSILIGTAEMVLQMHLRQFQVYSPVRMQVVAAEVDLPQPLDQAIEIRMKSAWPEWEELRLQLCASPEVKREFVLPIWNGYGRTLGSVVLRGVLRSDRLLASTSDEQ